MEGTRYVVHFSFSGVTLLFEAGWLLSVFGFSSKTRNSTASLDNAQLRKSKIRLFRIVALGRECADYFALSKLKLSDDV